MRPERLDLGKPTGEFTTEESVGRESVKPDLVGETAGGEERDSSGLFVQRPSFPYQPQVKIEYAGRVGQGGHDLALHRNPMLVDLIVEGSAENCTILVVG